MSDVEIRFTGDPHDAQQAALSIDTALEQIKKIADMVSEALGDITIGRGQVAEVQAGARVMASSIDEISRRAFEAAAAVHDVKFGAGQAAGVVAQAAVMSAALDRVSAAGDRAKRSMSMQELAVMGGPASSLINAAMTGRPYLGDSQRFVRPNPITGVQSGYNPYQYGSPIGPEFRRIIGDTGIPAGGRIGAYDMSLGQFGTGPDPRRSSRFFNDVPDPLNVRYGNQGILSSSSDRGRGGLLGYLFGARGGGSSGGGADGRIAQILGGFGDGSGGGSNRGRFGGGGGLSSLGSIVPGGGRATGAAFATAVGLAGTGLSDVGPGAIAMLAPIASLGAAGAASIGSLVIAFQGLGKAISGDQKSFDALTPSAQRFVQTVRGLEPWADKMQEVVRSNLFPGLTKALHEALTPGTAATIQSVLGAGARGTGAGAQVMGGYLGGQQFQQNFGKLGQMVEQDIPKWASITTHFMNTVLGLTNAFRPLIAWSVQGVQSFSALADKWVQSTAAAHGFDGTMQVAEQGLRDALMLVESLGKTLYELGVVLAPVGHALIVLVDDGLNGISDWVSAHRTELQTTLVNTFDLFGKTLHLVVPILATTADGVLALANAVMSLSNGFSAMPAVITAAVAAMLLLTTNPAIVALLAAMTALGYLSQGGGKDNFSGTMPGGTTNTADIKGKRLTNANEVIALRKKGLTDQQIQAYLMGDSKAIAGFPQFGKGSSGDIAMTSAFTDASALTTGQGPKGGIMPATSEAGNSVSGLLQGPHHTDGFPGSGKTAVDIAATVGAPVLAPEDGKITRDSGSAPKSGSNNINGYSLYYEGASGTNYFMTHMSWVAKPGAYKKGDKIGVIAAGTQGGPHLHIDYAPPVSMMGGPSTAGSGGSPFGTPPPFTAGSKAFTLPTGMQTSLASAQNAYLAAQGTPSTKDDAGAISRYRAQILKAEAYLRKQIAGGGLDPNDLLLATQELGTLIGTMNSIGKAAKSKVATASSKLAGLTSAKSVATLIGTALGPIGGLIPGADPTSPAGMIAATPLADAHTKYDSSLKAWMKQIDDFEKQLREKTISTAAVATIKTRIATIKTDVTSALSAIKDAAALQVSNFKSIWASYVQTFDDAFKQTTSDVLSHPEKYPAILPLSAALADLQDSHTQQQLQKALSDAQKQLADALSGTTDPSGALSRARDALGKDALAHALDVAQSTVMGGTSMDMTAKIIEDMQQALADAGVPDPTAVASAQQAVEDAKYNIQIDGMTKAASAEQAAYQQSRDDLQKHLDAALALWGDYYAKSGMTAADALDTLNALLIKFGFQPISDPFSNDTGGYATPGSSIGQVTVPTTSGDAGSQFGVGGRKIAMASGGLITSPHYLVDMHGVVQGMVGEGGLPELVAPVTPGMSANVGGRSSSNTGDTQVHVHFADGMQWLQQFVSVQVKKQTPQTSRTIGLTSDRRRREGRF